MPVSLLTRREVSGHNALSVRGFTAAQIATGTRRAPFIQPEKLPIADLPPHCATFLDVAGRWYIARVKWQQEAALMKALSAAGIDWCVPLQEKKSIRWGRRMVPLFAGYVPFAIQHDIDYFGVRERDCVCDILQVSNQVRFSSQLEAVLTATRTMKIDPWPHAKIGAKVRFKSGPLLGKEGVVINRDGRDVVVLQVDMLGQACSMEDVNPDDLEPA